MEDKIFTQRKREMELRHRRELEELEAVHRRDNMIVTIQANRTWEVSDKPFVLEITFPDRMTAQDIHAVCEKFDQTIRATLITLGYKFEWLPYKEQYVEEQR